MLFTDDAEHETEQRCVDAVQLYQVGHHGSRTSTSEALFDAVQPDDVVYSAGADNQFGHPHAETLNRATAPPAPGD